MSIRTRMAGSAVSVVGVLVLFGGFTAASTASSNTTKETPTPAQEAQLTSSEVTLLNSGQAINVTMDPTSGDITSVTSAAPTAHTASVPDITHRSAICDSGDGCYDGKPPYANQGFYGGAGTITGTWDERTGYTSGNYSVSACWGSGCGPQVGPNSSVSFTSTVTGTSFTIY